MGNASRYYRSSANSVHCWGDQCAVYHIESGDTHLLNKLDLNVLQRIKGKPLSAKDLSVEFEHVFDDGTFHYIQTLLSNLAKLGLIEAVKNESAH